MKMRCLVFDSPKKRCARQFLLLIGKDAYTLLWNGDAGEPAHLVAKSRAHGLARLFPFHPPSIASRVYHTHRALQPFLDQLLPVEALWRTVPRHHLLAERETSSFWWGGKGVVQRHARVRVTVGWNAASAGTRCLVHRFAEGQLLREGDSLPLRWEETLFTLDGPRVFTCKARLVCSRGKPLITLPLRQRLP